MAGTSNGRTTNVSSSTPTAVTIPNCTNSWIGNVANTRNVPAKMSPADVITAPVEAIPFFPLAVPGLFYTSITALHL